MRPYRQIAAIVFAGLGVFLAVQGIRFKLAGAFGPGPGFMPFVTGVLLALVSIAWHVRVSMTPDRPIPEDWLPEPGGLRRVALVLVATLVLAAVLVDIGFKLSMLAFLLVTFFVFGRDHVALKIVIAFAASFGIYYLFTRVLSVPLPETSFDVLRAVGL